MDEMIKMWISNMYEREILDTLSLIEDERVRALGCGDDEENCHEDNITRLNEYVSALSDLDKEVSSL